MYYICNTVLEQNKNCVSFGNIATHFTTYRKMLIAVKVTHKAPPYSVTVCIYVRNLKSNSLSIFQVHKIINDNHLA